MIKHTIMGGKVHVYKRDKSRYWQCATYLDGKNRRQSTKEEGLAQAKEFAEDWYLSLRGQLQNNQLSSGKNFMVAAKQFTREHEALTKGTRNPAYVADQYRRIKLHLEPFFGKMGIKDIGAGTVQEYRITRAQSEQPHATSWRGLVLSIRYSAKAIGGIHCPSR